MWLKRILSLFTSKNSLITKEEKKIYVNRSMSFKLQPEVLNTKINLSKVAISFYEYKERKPLIDSGEEAVGLYEVGMPIGVWEVVDMIFDCKNFGVMSNVHFDTGLYTEEFIEYLAKEIFKECNNRDIRTTRWLRVTWEDIHTRKYAEKLLLALEGEYLDHV